MVTDPATCQAPTGAFSHVYVTITDVQANVSASAGSSDSGWVDLTPSLSKAPQQIDLLGQANNQCFLATLGDARQLQAGNYQQIRILLAANTVNVSNNACGGSANCVVLASDSSVHTLQLSSEAQTGIKIPSGQIASGGFNIAAGQTKDLDIDFSTCESIVQEGNGQYRLKPVLHAGEVSATSTSINGKVLDGVTGNPVNGTVIVAVEQKDSSGVDRIARATLAGADGSFVFCPLPSGSYDVVIVGTRSDGSLYEPSIVTGVEVGATTGTVDLFAPASAAVSFATLAGMVTSQTSASAATVADIELSMLETVNSATYTIPLPPTKTQSSATLALETEASTATLTCPTGTDCAGYALTAPAGSANVGVWSASGTALAANNTLAAYKLDGLAFAQSSGGTADCSPSEITTAALVVTAGGATVNVPTVAFTGCQ
ncbi:DUF4382 domain-containing protein [Acidobacteria bacterium AB60]|nr:DUF4382 domain-containing protein [Acidobacteria bacterium AB60]